MNILGILFPYIVFFFLLDSIKIIRGGHLLFTSYFGLRFKLRTSGFHLPGLSPLGHAVYSHSLPICITKYGVYFSEENFFRRSLLKRQKFDYIPYDEMTSIEAEHKYLRINGSEVIKLPTLQGARYLADMIRRFLNLSEQERARKMPLYLNRSMNTGRIERLKRNFSSLFWPLKVLSSVLFVFVLVLLPLSLYTNVYFHMNLRGLLISMLLLYGGTILMSYLVNRRLYRGGSRKSMMLIMSLVFSPVTALHVLSNMTEGLYCRFDFIALSAVFLSKERFQRVCADELRRIKYFLGREMGSDFREYWEMRQKVLSGLLKKMGISVEEVMEQPARKDPMAEGYCPLCLAEYRTGYKRCPDCETDLEKYESPDDTALEKHD